MPIDQSGRKKIYPDSMYNFKWQHVQTGTISTRVPYILGEVPCNGQPDHTRAKASGYSCTPRDWRDVEQKVYIDTDTGSNFLSLFMGGNGSDQCPCCGSGYEMAFSSNGTIEARKKMYYGSVSKMKTVNIGALPEGPKGVCFIRINIHGNSAVRLEAWVDKTDHGFWKQVLTVVDNGFSFGNSGRRCGGSDRQALTWGFPVVGFSANFDCNFSNMTAREINPGGSFNEGGTGGGQARPRGGGGGNPLPATVDDVEV